MCRERTIFADALAKPSLEEQRVFLDQACDDDVELRQRVEILLAAHARAGSFLESPPAALTTPESEDVTERPGTMVGPYKLLEQIGEGGMGIVYMAEQVSPLRRKVALKIIKPGMDTKHVIARFEAERQALAMMDHPNIAKVFEAGATAAERPYFVMELVRGTPITEYCDDQELSPRQRLKLFIDVCQAVQHAHQKGIIHRDLKPNNVLVTVADDGTPIPKVIDFGIAKATAGEPLTERTLFTQLRQLVGTPLYMSPEQAETSAAQDVDTRSDIYSLGVLMYELLTGSTPFDRQRLGKAAHDEIRRIIREEEPPRPSLRISTLGATLTTVSAKRQTDPRKLGAMVRGELDWIVMRALEKDRNRRYETAVGLAQDIGRYLSDQPVEACPPSALYRMRKLARRNRVAIVTTSLVAAAMVIGTTFSVGFAIRAGRAESRVAAALELALQEKQRADQQERTTRRLHNAAQVNLAYQAWQAGDIKRAFQLLDMQLPTAPEEDLPTFPSTIYQRAFLYQHAGRFPEALADLERVHILNPSDILSWDEAAELHAYLGHLQEYLAARKVLLAHLDKEKNTNAVGTCLMYPLDMKSGRAAVISIDKLLTSVDAGTRPYYQCTKGLAEYRCGNFAEAIKWVEIARQQFDESIRKYPALAPNRSWDESRRMGDLVLAMCEYRMGHDVQAREMLLNGEKDVQRYLTSSGWKFGGRGWLMVQVLSREAHETIDEKPSETSSKHSTAAVGASAR